MKLDSLAQTFAVLHGTKLCNQISDDTLQVLLSEVELTEVVNKHTRDNFVHIHSESYSSMCSLVEI